MPRPRDIEEAEELPKDGETDRDRSRDNRSSAATTVIGESFHDSEASLSRTVKSNSLHDSETTLLRVPVDLSVLELVQDHHDDLNGRSEASLNFSHIVDRTSKSGGSFAVDIDPALLHTVEESRCPPEDDDPNQRESVLFCFSCCDMVKACVIFNVVNIASMAFLMAVSLLEPDGINRINLYVVVDDDELERRIGIEGIYALARMALGMAFGALGIVGAVQFRKWPVLATGIWYVAYLFMSILVKRWDGAALAAIYAYPNFHLFHQLHKERLTRTNYAAEKYCCCVRPCEKDAGDE